MSTTVATSRAYGAAVAENVVAALNSMGAQPQGCYGAQAPVPALALDFLTQSLDPRITFSRADGAGKATRVNSAGLIETVPVNLVTYSQGFGNAIWVGTPNTIKTSTNNPAPDGTNTALLLTNDVTTSSHNLYSGLTFTPSLVPYTLSVFLKANGSTRAQLTFAAGNWGTSQYANFSLTGVGSVLAASTPANASITSVGNGWYRCSWTATATATTTAAMLSIGFIDSDTATRLPIYTGASSESVFVWGAQLQTGSVATTYIPTTTAASGAPRFDYDPVTLAPRGLLIEESRANYVLNSAVLSSLAGITSKSADGSVLDPTGNSSYKIIADSTTANHGVYPDGGGTCVVTPDVTYAKVISAYLRAGTHDKVQLHPSTAHTGGSGVGYYANFDLTLGTKSEGANIVAGSSFIYPAGNGWWRCGFAYVPTSAVSGYPIGITFCSALADGRGPSISGINGLFFHYAAMSGYEMSGSANLTFPTSYIPTTTAAVTRAADVASMTGTNFSSWFNATEGTFVASADCIGSVSGAGGNRTFSVAGTAVFDQTLGNSLQNQYKINASFPVANVSPITLGVPFKSAGAWSGSTYSVSARGGDVVTGSAVPSGNTGLHLGQTASPGQFLNGHLQRITYYNKRLPDATLKALSA